MRRPFLALVFLAPLGCDPTGPKAPATVTVELPAAQLEQGDTARATVSVKDADGKPIAGLPVTYASSAPIVATVDTAGLVTAVSVGAVEITATVKTVSGKAPVTVILTVSTVNLTLPSSTVDVGDSTKAAPTASSVKGIAVTGRPVTYGTSNAAVATVSSAGYVRGVGAGSATITATIDGKSGSAPVTVQAAPASVVITPPSPRIDMAGTLQLTATALDASGGTVPGRTFTWTSADPQRVTVSSTGLATWRAPGRTAITATTGATSATIQLATAGDFSITGVYFTQGVQDADGTIPMVAGEAAAAALVLMTTQSRVTASMRVVLRLLNGDGSLAWSDTATVSDAIDVTTSLATSAARLLIPANQIKAGLKWQVLRDPKAVSPDDSAATDLFPRGAPATFNVVNVPTLKVRLVPIMLAAHGNSVPTIAQSDLAEYLRTVRSSVPYGTLVPTIGASFATNASFGTPPSGGASAFWQQVLSELDIARSADPGDPATYWMGVVGPPSGFNFTQFGGFGYVPNNPQSTGSTTRTALGVRIGWFSNPTQARDNIAHELGHNFGRRHSPCGGPTGIDPSYPRPDGRLGQLMHDVFAWSNPQSTLFTIPETNGDLMGYCFPLWASAYTYQGIISARGTIPAPAAGSSLARTDVVFIQGTIPLDGERSPTILPLVALRARPSLPGRGGNHHLQGYDSAGALLFDHAFTPTPVDHEPGIALFSFALPVDSTVLRLSRVRVSGPGGTAVMTEPALRTTPEAEVGREGNMVAVRCNDAFARIAVQDEATGRLLGVSTTGVVRVAAGATRLGVSCGRSVRPTRSVLAVP